MHGGHADEAPRTVKLYVNRDVEFDCVEAAVATHTLHMPSTMSDEAEFPLSLAKFNNVSSVSLFVCDNYGGSVCRLQYVGLKGTFLAPKVTPPCSCVQPQLQPPLHTLPHTHSLTRVRAGEGGRHKKRGVRGQAADARCAAPPSCLALCGVTLALRSQG